MRSLRRIALVVGGVLAGSGGCFALATGCGGDDTTSTSDSGPDATNDSSLPDVHADSTSPDTSTTSDSGDSGHPDASDSGGDGGGDSGHDGGGDSSADSAADSAADSGGDAGDGGDALAALLAFPAQQVAAICARQASCCSTAAPDAGVGPYDASACEANNVHGISSISLLGVELIDGGHVAFNQAMATACLADIQNLPCDSSLTAAGSAQILNDCINAIIGTQAANAPCKGTIECAPGEFCVLPTDGGATGACAPLRTAGQPCGNFGGITDSHGPTTEGPLAALQACSFRANGATHLTCGEYDPDGGFIDFLPTSQWVCLDAGATGDTCNYNQDCTSFLCDVPAFTCQTTGGASPVSCP